MDLLAKMYPEKQIAGFCRNDHRVVFFSQVNALLRPHMTVLEFGAGRGKWGKLEGGFKRDLTTLRGKCETVIGVDVDPAVLKNNLVDKALVIRPDQPLPFDDNSVDIIVSWAVLEHIDTPELVASEFRRVLRDRGWICAWTPSKWSYFAVAARLIPDRFHTQLVQWTGSSRKEEDIFPTVYKVNTLREVSRYFPECAFDNFSYYFNGPPTYHANKRFLALTWKLWMWLLPAVFSQQIHVFLRKKLQKAGRHRE